MNHLMPWIAAGSLVGLCAAGTPSSAAPAPPFRAAVEAHLAAISARDMDRLLPTLTAGNDLTMIAPNGHKLDTRQQYIDFHRQWFATKDDGKYAAEIVRLIESPALAHALIKYRYSSKGEAGKPNVIDSWLTLTFALEDGSWRLVFDQNTLLDPRAGQ
jgi:ketosteroid isomerase-like protein